MEMRLRAYPLDSKVAELKRGGGGEVKKPNLLLQVAKVKVFFQTARLSPRKARKSDRANISRV